MKCCNYCGSKLNGFLEYCPVCCKKFNLREQNKDVIKSIDKKIIKNCPSCGSEIYGTSNFCTQCGISLKKEQDYTRLLLPNPINDYPNKVKRIRYVVNIPQICPICGSRRVQKEYKIKPWFYYEKKHSTEYDKNRSYLKVFFCQRHTQSSLKKSHIFHEYYPELGAVVSVKNHDWAEEFRMNNKCVHVVGPIEYDLSEFEKLKRRYEIYEIIFPLLMLTFGFLGLMFSIIKIQKYSYLCYVGFFVFICVSIYYFSTASMQHEKRLQKYLDYLKFLNT